jgi:sialate O-acetylesterase
MLTLHSLLGDHAVFQRGKPITISGTASPGSSVSIQFSDQILTVTAGPEGAWSAVFAAPEETGPFELVVENAGRTLRRSDLLVGEVWLCSGQSNMEWTLAMTLGAEAEINAADDPLVRCFTVMRTPAVAPAAEPDGKWEVASPGTAGHFSAVAWFFARRLRARLGCPVGLIVPAFGGTRIASWLPAETLAARPEYAGFLAPAEDPEAEELQPHVDEGRTPDSAGWETCDDSAWETLEVPGMWQQQGWQLNGAVWYRRTVELPAEWKGRGLVLHFGALDDFDETYVNGVRVGGMGLEAPSAYATKRLYPVPAELTRDGRLVIAARVFDQWGFGGVVGPAALRLADNPELSFSLEGPWKARVEKAFPLRLSSRPIPPEVLFNGMIHPLAGVPVRGFLWYQGESDAGCAALYRLLLPDLIAAWRTFWKDPRLPFGIVQLANYKAPETDPGESEWAELRDAQLLASRTVPRAGLAVAIDLGEADNIHPRLKAPVGERLARWALAEVYAEPDGVWHSPLPADHWCAGGAMAVRFSHAGAGLRSREDLPLSGFQIASADRRWTWARAEIVAPDIVRVSSDDVPDPVAVRYGWQNNPVCTLENSAGLPASPFRTDDWKLSTRS